MRGRDLVCALLAACVALLGGWPASASASSGLGPLIVEPDDGYAPVHALLASPKHSLDLTMYELRDPDAQNALIADSVRGVRVRVLLDRQYNGGPYNTPAFQELSAHGVPVRWASTKVAITHQKSFVIDGKRAVIMTGNLTSSYYKTGRDYALGDTKSKDVVAIESTFELDWANSSGTAPAGSDLVWSPGSQAPLVALIESAKHTLQVENEELAAPAIVSALEAAAKRGVEVQLTMTNQPAWHGSFDALEAAGVQVRTYRPSASLYIHAKTIAVDGQRVFLGSENFSLGSLQRNRELGLITVTKPIVQRIEQTFAKDFAGATPWP